jgi:hypothetical protein
MILLSEFDARHLILDSRNFFVIGFVIQWFFFREKFDLFSLGKSDFDMSKKILHEIHNISREEKVNFWPNFYNRF